VRVLLIGAGGISEHHAKALENIDQAELAGFIDLDQDKANEAISHYGGKLYQSIDAAIQDGVEVAHILTPPDSHAKIAIDCLDKGLHVLVEKPLGISIEECEAIDKAAKAANKLATVNHSLLYDPEILKAIELVKNGAVGDVVSVDIIRSSVYPSYPGGQLPPHYREPGYPFRDIGVHALYMIQQFLGPIKSVEGKYRSLGGDHMLAYDEWRAVVDCEKGMGQMHLSWNINPLQNMMLIQGTKGVLRVDSFHMFTALRRTTPAPKAIERVINTIRDSSRPLYDTPKNVVAFIMKKRKPYQGLHNLLAAFYESINNGKPLPVSIQEAKTVVHWTESLARQADKDYKPWNELNPTTKKGAILVTGGNGGVGSAVVASLLKEDKQVRILVRRPPKDANANSNVEYVVGDLGNPAVVAEAVKDTSAVVHVGATMSGDWDAFQGGTIEGTKNVLAAMQQHNVKKLVYISSMSVVDWAGSDQATVVDESASLEPRSDERGAYTKSKLEAEKLVVEASKTGYVDSVILRPGQIFGGKLPLMTGAVRRKAGSVSIVLGDGKLTLPMIYIDDVVHAINLSLEKEVESGTIVQLVDPSLWTQRDVIKASGEKGKVIYLPRAFVFGIGGLSEKVLGLIGKQSPFARYRLSSALARLKFESDRAEKVLGWKPIIGVKEGIQKCLSSANN
jgi:predicted dehydrogenase/nucleoside-diphosphate-sugar epimerase